MRYKKFEGDRVYFSPIDVNDYQTFTKWVNDETLSRGIGSLSSNISELSEKEYLENASKDMNKYQFSVIKKSDDSLIGTYDLHGVSLVHGFAEVGGFIGEPSERGKGYGTESLRMICDFGFNVLDLNCITAGFFEFNYASRRHLEKVGFKKAGEIKERYFLNGVRYSSFIYQITKKEFNSLYKTFLKPLPEYKEVKN